MQDTIPKQTEKKTIFFVEEITKGIIRRELAIQNKYHTISKKLEEKVFNNTISEDVSEFPTLSEIKKTMRFDTGLYEKEYKELISKIKNYKHGYFTIHIEKIKSVALPRSELWGKDRRNGLLLFLFMNLALLLSMIISCAGKQILQKIAWF